MAEKVALVTASSAGLGAAIAKTLISTHRVVINYNSSPQRADSVLKELNHLSELVGTSSSGDQLRCIAIQANVSSGADVGRLVAEAVSKMGRLDAVVSNVGWTRIRDFSNFDDNLEEDDWDRCFNANVKSHLRLLQAAREHLEKTQGSFTTVASVAGVKPSGSSLPYAVTKAAQIYMVKCLAGMVGPNIRVNSVSPGILMTDWGKQFPQEALDRSKEKTVLKRFATVEDVSEQVKVLIKSQSMTGVNAVLDSGFSL